jgi:transposase
MGISTSELAWLWQRYQLASAQVSGFRERISGTGRRMRKVMVVALARKLLVALWRFATQALSRMRDQEAGVLIDPKD